MFDLKHTGLPLDPVIVLPLSFCCNCLFAEDLNKKNAISIDLISSFQFHWKIEHFRQLFSHFYSSFFSVFFFVFILVELIWKGILLILFAVECTSRCTCTPHFLLQWSMLCKMNNISSDWTMDALRRCFLTTSSNFSPNPAPIQ